MCTYGDLSYERPGNRHKPKKPVSSSFNLTNEAVSRSTQGTATKANLIRALIGFEPQQRKKIFSLKTNQREI